MGAGTTRLVLRLSKSRHTTLLLSLVYVTESEMTSTCAVEGRQTGEIVVNQHLYDLHQFEQGLEDWTEHFGKYTTH